MRGDLRIPAAAIATAALLGGCGGGDEGAKSGAKGCREVTAPAPRHAQLKAPPAQTVKRGQRLSAVVKTSCGAFTIVLDTSRAPKTTNSFAYLVRKGFYNGLGVVRSVPPHFGGRAIAGYIQAGDPREDGTGGPGFSVDEPPPPNLAYTRGIVAMAKSPVEPPGRSGSQFLVVVAPALPVSPDYALLGRVGKGLGVVERIAALGTRTGETKQPVVIDTIKLSRPNGKGEAKKSGK